MIEPVRPIALEDIEEARERIAGTRAAHASGQARSRSRRARHPAQARKSPADQRLQDPRRRQCGRQAERRRAARGVWTVSAGNAGQGVAYAARAAGIPARWSRSRRAADQARPDGGARREIVPVPMKSPGRRSPTMNCDGEKKKKKKKKKNTPDEAFAMRWHDGFHPSVRQSRFHRRPCHDGPRNTGGRARRARRDRRDRRRRADHRRGQRDQGAAAGHQGLRRRAGDGGALCLVAARGRAAATSPTGRRVRRRRRRARASPTRMWERMLPLVDGAIIVSLEQTRQAMRLLAEKARVIAEGAGALSPAAALTGEAGEGPIVCVHFGRQYRSGEIRFAGAPESIAGEFRLPLFHEGGDALAIIVASSRARASRRAGGRARRRGSGPSFRGSSA